MVPSSAGTPVTMSLIQNTYLLFIGNFWGGGILPRIDAIAL